MLAQGDPSQNTPSPGTPVIAPLANLVGHRAEAGLVAVVRSHHWEGNRVHHPRSSRCWWHSLPANSHILHLRQP